MPLKAYLWARHHATNHLQVEVVGRGEIGQMADGVPTRVRVARVFKSSSGMQVGAELSVRVKVCHDSPPPDAGGWIEAEQYQALRYFEVYLTGELQELRIAAGGAEIHPIAAISDLPTVPCPTREQAEAEEARFEARRGRLGVSPPAARRRPWWRFW